MAVIAGICNSIMDSGAYPALLEAFPKSTGISAVLIKAFISFGAMILPIMVSFLIDNNVFYGYSFFIPAFIFMLNGIFLSTVRFPTYFKASNVVSMNKESRYISKPRIWVEGMAIILIGFTSTALLMVAQVWLPKYGYSVIGMSRVESIYLLSYYNVGAFVSVLLLAVVLNRFISPILILVIYPSLATISLVLLLFVQQPVMTLISSFLIGFSTAGLFQLCIAVIVEFFPRKKGTTTAYVSTASSSAFIIIPMITGLINKNINVTAVFFLDLIIAIISVLLSLNVCFRYKKIFNKKLLYRKLKKAS